MQTFKGHTCLLTTLLMLVTFTLAAPIAAQADCAEAQGRDALEAGNYDTAISVFSCMIATDATQARGYVGREQAYLLSGRWLDARSDFLSAELSWPHQGWYSDANFEEAERLINAHPNDPAGYMLRAWQEWWLDANSQVLSDTQHILELDPDNLLALILSGSSGMFMDTPGWEAHFTHAIRLSPNNPNVLTLIGMSYLWAGQPDKTLIYLGHVPDFASAIHYHGRANFDTQQYGAAVQDFQRAMELDMGAGARVQTLIWLGSTYLKLNQTSDAAAAFDQANALFPQGPDTAQEIGQAYLNSHDEATAAYWFNQFILRVEEHTLNGQALTVGVPVRVTIERYTVIRFPIRLTAGATLAFHAEASNAGGGPFDPLIVLLAPDGTPLRANDDKSVNKDLNSLIDQFTVPADGVYTLALAPTFLNQLQPTGIDVSVTAAS